MILNVKNSSSIKSKPVATLKQQAYIYLPFLTNLINHTLYENTFPDELKQTEVISL